MTKNSNTFVIVVAVIVIIAVVVLVVKPAWLTFIITGNEKIVRQSYPSLVDPGASFSVTYEVTNSVAPWGVSVEDILTCKNSTGTMILTTGMTQKFVMISDAGTVAIKTFNVPNTMGLQCQFQGDYKFGNKSTISFPIQTMQTRGKNCASGADTNSDGTVSREELGVVINAWISNSVTRDKLGQAIMDWSGGC